MLRLFMAIVVATSLSSLALAGVPQELNHQGKVSVSGVPFDGTGLFRFAIVDLDTGQNLWTNDNTNVGAIGTPTNAVSLPVISGIYNVRLGNTNLANMGPIAPQVFNRDNTSLRIWFDDGVNGAEQLLPDHKISASPYSHRAADGVPIGSIMAWHKSMTGVPVLQDSWVECNGQVLADIESVLNGQTIPDLNNPVGTGQGGRFLRGSSVSGTPQDDAFQGHHHQTQLAISTFVAGQNQSSEIINRLAGTQGHFEIDVNPTVRTLNPTTGEHGAIRTDFETRPVNMSVVWIMRVK